jgi:adenylylsulfate kinase
MKRDPSHPHPSSAPQGATRVEGASTEGFVLWFTGLPSSGKSTLARAVAAELRALDTPTILLDGDEVRAALRPSPAYDEASRDAFYETLTNLAALACAQGLVVLVAATAHKRAFRARARDALGDRRFAEVFVDTPLSLCEQRDSKGLYRASSDGAVATLPGVGAAYERPEAPALIVYPDEPAAPSRVARWLVDRRKQEAPSTPRRA